MLNQSGGGKWRCEADLQSVDQSGQKDDEFDDLKAEEQEEQVCDSQPHGHKHNRRPSMVNVCCEGSMKAGERLHG